jgi:hypothetical protein
VAVTPDYNGDGRSCLSGRSFPDPEGLVFHLFFSPDCGGGRMGGSAKRKWVCENCNIMGCVIMKVHLVKLAACRKWIHDRRTLSGGSRISTQQTFSGYSMGSIESPTRRARDLQSPIISIILNAAIFN